MDYQRFAEDLMDAVGGTENVRHLMHCMTRLRFTLSDESKADTARIKKLDGVTGVISANGQYQVVMGDNVVPAFDAIQERYHVGGEMTQTQPVERRRGVRGVWDALVDYLSGTMVKILPLFIGCGLFSVVLSVLSMAGVMTQDSSTYAVINAASKVVFYFLPCFVGFAAAEKLGCSPFLGAATSLFLMYPDIMGMAGSEQPATLFGIPFAAVNYSSTVFPSLIGAWLLSYVEPNVYKLLPNALKTVFGPFITLLIMFPLMLFIVGPVGYYLGIGIAQFFLGLSSLPFGIGCALLSAVQPLLVTFGAHTVLAAPMIQSLTITGTDALIRPAFITSCFASFGTLLAIVVRAKHAKLKGIAASCALTQFMGGMEPALYGIYLPLIKPFISTVIGAFVGGMVSSVLGARAFSMGQNGVFGLLVFQETIPQILIAVAAAIVVSFIATCLLGFDEEKIEA